MKRLKALRKALGLNQSEFAEKIGVAQNTVSQIENSSIGLNERNAKIICLTFDVNEHWLRTGEGEMFESSFKTPFEKEVEGFDMLTPDEGELIGIYRKLTPPHKEKVMGYADDQWQLQQLQEQQAMKAQEKKITVIQTLEKAGDGDYSSLKKVE